MRIVIGTVTALVVWGGAGLAAADQVHTAKGKVVSVDQASVIMVLENGHRHALELSPTTEAYGEYGQQSSARAFQPGDYVEEDCVSVPGGGYLARRITLLRAAWREIGSPEN